MDSAKKSLSNLRAAALKHKGAEGKIDDAVIGAFTEEFNESVNDDLNIPRALGVVWNMARYDVKSDKIYLAIINMDKILGLDLDREEITEQPSAADPGIEEQIVLRAAAKKMKNYAEADRIRKELAAKGIILTDTPDGTTYKIEN
jgi:cysteinyl-tRNA synthetase